MYKLYHVYVNRTYLGQVGSLAYARYCINHYDPRTDHTHITDNFGKVIHQTVPTHSHEDIYQLNLRTVGNMQLNLDNGLDNEIATSGLCGNEETLQILESEKAYNPYFYF